MAGTHWRRKVSCAEGPWQVGWPAGCWPAANSARARTSSTRHMADAMATSEVLRAAAAQRGMSRASGAVCCGGQDGAMVMSLSGLDAQAGCHLPANSTDCRVQPPSHAPAQSTIWLQAAQQAGLVACAPGGAWGPLTVRGAGGRRTRASASSAGRRRLGHAQAVVAVLGHVPQQRPVVRAPRLCPGHHVKAPARRPSVHILCTAAGRCEHLCSVHEPSGS